MQRKISIAVPAIISEVWENVALLPDRLPLGDVANIVYK